MIFLLGLELLIMRHVLGVRLGDLSILMVSITVGSPCIQVNDDNRARGEVERVTIRHNLNGCLAFIPYVVKS